MLVDSYERQITYLRVSVTDLCNLRCVYCMPAEGVVKQPHAAMMRHEETAQVIRVAAENGVRAVRLTGGEPLVRRSLSTLVEMIAAIPQIEDISLTTNALLLEKMAASLAAAGVRRLNISLDTLQPEKFTQITRGGELAQVWRGIEAAEASGMQPIKINVVVMKGVNDDEIPDLARLSLTHPWTIRFIEVMPVKYQSAEGVISTAGTYLPVQAIKKILEPLGLEPATTTIGHGPAREYRLAGALGRVGFISPLGEHFCASCNRLRLTADGHLRPCLLSDVEIPILEPLRRGEPILPYLQQAAAFKPAGHELALNHQPNGRWMRQIGG
jgi:GTP 3',8-cyclase